jgi:hypothetical protein
MPAPSRPSQSIEQRFVPLAARDAQFLLIEGALSDIGLTTLARREARAGALRADLRILGVSHAAEYHLDGAVVSELLVCRPTQVPPERVEARWTPAMVTNGWGTIGEIAAGRLRVETKAFLSSAPEEAASDARKRATAQDRGVRLFYEYPAAAPDQPPAVTYIEFSDGLYTVHTYPGDGLAIRTRTSLIVDGTGRVRQN